MMQGDNGNIKELLGIASFIDYLAIYLIHHCIIVFCLYNDTALYNIPIVFKIFALLACISRMLQVKHNLAECYNEFLTFSVENYLVFHAGI